MFVWPKLLLAMILANYMVITLNLGLRSNNKISHIRGVDSRTTFKNIGPRMKHCLYSKITICFLSHSFQLSISTLDTDHSETYVDLINSPKCTQIGNDFIDE